MFVADLSNMAAETHADAVRRVEAAAQDLIRRAGVAVAAQMLLDEEHERIRVNQHLDMVFDMSKCHFFDAQTEQVIA